MNSNAMRLTLKGNNDAVGPLYHSNNYVNDEDGVVIKQIIYDNDQMGNNHNDQMYNNHNDQMNENVKPSLAYVEKDPLGKVQIVHYIFKDLFNAFGYPI